LLSYTYSAALYANATNVLSDNMPVKLANKFIKSANVLSEYLGIYLFVLSIPMVVNAVTDDDFLQISVATVAIVSLLLYSLSDFSMFNIHIRKSVKYVISVVIAGLGAGLFMSQLFIGGFFVIFSVVLLVSILATTAFYYQKEE
jgi:hypothetical protein